MRRLTKKKMAAKLEIQEPETIKKESNGAKSSIVKSENEEYEIVEREILPEKIVCPDCGGVTLDGLDFCHKCGGELNDLKNGI